jgi:hypothetical protein
VHVLTHRFVCIMSRRPMSSQGPLEHATTDEFFPWFNLARIVLPASLVYIQPFTFNIHDRLTSVTLPDTLKSIGHHAFVGCEALITIELPDSLEEIHKGAFLGCKGLSAVVLSVEHSSLRLIGPEAFYNCNSLTNFDFPKSLVTMGFCAFFKCTKLLQVKLPDALLRLDTSVFYGCTGLVDVTLPAYLEAIHCNAFHSCSFSSISFPQTIREIQDGAFKNTKLISVVLPSSLTTVDESPFTGCLLIKLVVNQSSLSVLKVCFPPSEWHHRFAHEHNLTQRCFWDTSRPVKVKTQGERVKLLTLSQSEVSTRLIQFLARCDSLFWSIQFSMVDCFSGLSDVMKTLLLMGTRSQLPLPDEIIILIMTFHNVFLNMHIDE